MGVSVHLIKLPEETLVRKDDDFDVSGMVGIREFSSWLSDNGTHKQLDRGSEINNYYDDTSYCRPKDFKDTRAWINKDICEGNRDTFLKLVDVLEKDSNSWLEFCY
ncbi:hypothetical protein LCGC14_2674050 [marine sediment metagenome]|uniref:Uncharacterized protein n=1 Tax=marine sediment metagenome TaxID=412755 RepID=A0A0F8ZN85_9ZZZZ